MSYDPVALADQIQATASDVANSWLTSSGEDAEAKAVKYLKAQLDLAAEDFGLNPADHVLRVEAEIVGDEIRMTATLSGKLRELAMRSGLFSLDIISDVEGQS